MISVNDFRTGLTIEVDGGIWRVVDFQHVKPGKGAAFVRSKLRNLRTGAIQEKTFRAGEKWRKRKSKQNDAVSLCQRRSARVHGYKLV